MTTMSRVLVITGAGDSFCAGMDLKEVFHALKDQPARYDKVIRLATEWRGRTLRYFPKPTIAMINGYCFGGAFSIVEGCDLAIAADEATFGLSEINFKGFPGGAVSKSLANLLRPRDALFYALTGRRFGGKVAAQIGLVNFSVPLAQLKAETMAVAQRHRRQGSERAQGDEGQLSLLAGDDLGSVDELHRRQGRRTRRPPGCKELEGRRRRRFRRRQVQAGHWAATRTSRSRATGQSGLSDDPSDLRP